MRSRYRHAIFNQSPDMHLDCLMHPLFRLLPRLSCCCTTGKIWWICWVITTRFLYYDKEPVHVLIHSFKFACFRILFRVPGAISSAGCPAIVILPGFFACLYWRWLPLVATRYQPSASMMWMISRTFRQTPLGVISIHLLVHHVFLSFPITQIIHWIRTGTEKYIQTLLIPEQETLFAII